MKIGILTHPLSSNYGGILQCYALNTFLQKLGHETIVIDRRTNKDLFLWCWIRSILKALHFPRYYKPTTLDKTVKIREFVDSKFKRTPPIDSPAKMKMVCEKYKLDAVIVGSDQVWRADYAMNFGYNYFLDFVPNNVIKASYAASFGLSDWQYPEQQTHKIKHLLGRFKGISVRESEAVSLLRENTDILAEHVLDPTLLLSAKEYDGIIAERQIADPYIFVYWLGDKTTIQNSIANYKVQGLKVVDINLRDETEQHSIEKWLSFIKYAETVITDSFHGCVFSIIFNKHFIIHANDSGGNGRLTSLFSQLGIIEKLMNPDARVEYQVVNSKIVNLQTDSKTFINKVLTK